MLSLSEVASWFVFPGGLFFSFQYLCFLSWVFLELFPCTAALVLWSFTFKVYSFLLEMSLPCEMKLENLRNSKGFLGTPSNSKGFLGIKVSNLMVIGTWISKLSLPGLGCEKFLGMWQRKLDWKNNPNSREFIRIPRNH